LTSTSVRGDVRRRSPWRNINNLSPAAARKVDTASEISLSEWFRCLVQIRPETSTRELLSIIYAVLMEISYVVLYIDDIDINQDVGGILERVAMAGLTSGY
jgi:hypothetical protein